MFFPFKLFIINFFILAVNGDGDKEISRPGSGLGLNHGMGRITGSASIETLVRVGIEKEHGLSPDSKMVVLHDFTPCVDDELEVKRGQIVNILYRENDWVYVIGQDTRQEGFIPHSYCAPYNTQLADLAIKKKLPREQNLPNDLADGVVEVSPELLEDAITPSGVVVSGLNGPGGGGGSVGGVVGNNGVISGIGNNTGGGGGVGGGGGGTTNIGGMQSPLKHSQVSLSSEPDFLPFAKDPSGRYIVLYTFIARDENDVSVERGEFVTVLNREDPDWFWIVRSDGQEGFIPSGFVYPADNVLQSKSLTQQGNNNSININNNGNGHINLITANQTNNNTSNMNNGLNNNLNTSPAHNSNQTSNCGGNGGQQQQQSHQQMVAADDLRYHGTELVMLYDYKVLYLFNANLNK